MNLDEYINKHPDLNGRNLRAKEHSDFVNALLLKTSFLDDAFERVPLGFRYFCYSNNITEVPKCPVCKGFQKIGKSKNGLTFTTFCSKKCTAIGTLGKRKETIEIKYGVDHHMKLDSTKQKIKNTCQIRYGVDSYFQTEEFTSKTEETSLERYGVNHPAKSEKTKKTRLHTVRDRYGVDNVSQVESVKDSMKSTFNERYGVDNPQKNESVRRKTKKTCLEIYGFENPNSSEVVKHKRKATSLKRYGFSNHMKKHYSEEYLNLISNPELLQKEYTRLKSSYGIAKEYGIGSHRTILNVLHANGITIEKSLSSYQETKITSILDSLGIDYISNDRSIIGPKEVDILVPSYNLAIEVNGIYYHSDKFKNMLYHQEKSLNLIEAGYKPFHIYEDQIKDEDKFKVIIKKLMYFVNKSDDKIFARKCDIDFNISKEEYSKLYNLNHIQGSISSSINIGLRYEGKLVACLSLSKRSSSSNDFVLTRFSTDKPIPGAFSKLLHAFKNSYDWNSILTYASLDYSNGDLYRSNGFEYQGITHPNYFYIDGNLNRYSRQQFMKSKLKNRLEIYDENLTEKELMNLNGYLRIYDSGSLKFILENK